MVATTAFLTALALAPATANAQAPTSVDLADSTSSESTFRIPAMTVTPVGTVIAAFDRRPDSGDLPNDIDTVVRRSTDNGATWSDPVDAVNYPDPQGCGDPSLLTDESSGRIFLFCTFSHGAVGFQNSQPGSADDSDPKTLHLRMMTSDDDGATWSEPVDLNSQVKDPAWAGVFASSGHGIQTTSGRLIQPIVVRDADGNHHSANIYSDDHGETWKRGELLDSGTDESKVFPLADGRVVQNSRNLSGGTRLLSVSEDDGATFGAAKPIDGIPDPGVNADEIRVNPDETGDNRAWLLFSNPASTSARENLTLRLSCDSGSSWPVSKQLHDGPSGYSTMAMLPDGRIGLFAELDGESFDRLTFMTLSFSDLDPC